MFSEMAGSKSRNDRGTESQRTAFRNLIASYSHEQDSLPLSIFQDNYESIGPRAMIAVLDEDRLCHTKGHNLGRVIYTRTNDLAASTAICRNSCSDGCVHGVLMSYFAKESSSVNLSQEEHHVSINDVTPALKISLSRICENSAITKYTGIGNCYHAVGHALATVADYDVTSAIGLCDIFTSHGPGAVYYCATGVYMERELLFGDSDVKTPANPLYPCDAGQYPAGCYRYKMTRLLKNIADVGRVIDICKALPDAQEEGCFHGIGFAASPFILKNPYILTSVCNSGTDRDQQMCLEGVFGYTNLYDQTVAKRACVSFEGSRALCDEASRIENFTMQRDFTHYVSR